MARSPDPDLAEKRRRQILDAASICFARRGFHQATMQEICTEAGLSPGAFYRYFSSKADLILAFADEDRRSLMEPLQDRSEPLRFFERLRRVGAVWLQRISERDRTLVAEVLAEAVRDEAFGRKLAGVDAPVRAVIAELVQEGQATGEIDPSLDVEQSVRLLMAAMDGMALRALLFDTQCLHSALADAELLFRKIFACPDGGALRRNRAAAQTMEPVA